MINTVKNWITEENLIQPGDTVICATSGGVDSMVMLDILNQIKDELGIKLYAAYYNHHIRSDKETELDEGWVKMVCHGYNIEYFIGGGDVLGRAAQTGESVEEAARAMRYEFLESLIPGAKIATAHHANDNLETMLMNIVRGCGTNGICGIPPRRGNIIRPMLCLTREQILEYSEEYRVGFVEDSTNKSDDYMRNRIRHHIIPMLMEENKNAVSNAFNTSKAAREDNRFIEDCSEEYMEAAEIDEGCYFANAIKDIPKAIQSRVVMQIFKKNGVCFSKKHIDQFVNCINSDKTKYSISVPGYTIVNRNGIIQFEAEETNNFVSSTPIEIGQVVEFGDTGKTVTISKVENVSEVSRCRYNLMISANKVKGNLYIRSRMDGDRIKMPGGTKSLVRVMRDFKIPENERNNYPVICDDNGVVAVAGIGINMNYKVDVGESAYLFKIDGVSLFEIEAKR